MLDFNQPIPISSAWLPPDMIDAELPLRFSQPERRVMRRKKAIRPSVWAEKYRVLPDNAAEPGPWKNWRLPYAAGIMDASFFESVQEIIVCAAPQTGKSEINYTCLGYATDRRPGNALIVFPDENTAKDNSKDRIQPMFEDSPRLREYLTGYTDDMGAVKIKLQNAIFYMAWANSAARLANRPLPYVVLDEEDKYPETATKREGSPTDLAKKRTRTFAHMRKIWRTSSPSVETGPIWKALTEECQLVFDFWVRCPKCGAWQKMMFEQIKWPKEIRDPIIMKTEQKCWYECVKCNGKWDNVDRDLAVRSGEWRDRDKSRSLMTALNSVKPVTIGFHIPSWLSPFVKLWEVAHAFLEGLKDRIKMRDFRNGHTAEPSRTISVARSYDRILSLADDRPKGVVPGGGQVACLLAGCDTQDDGLFYEIRAFGYGLERPSWCIREGKAPTFDALAQILWRDQYKDLNGNIYPVRLTLQDAMGHRASEVYDFCRMHRGQILPTMGNQTMAQPFAYSNREFYPGTKKPIPGGIQLVRFDTNYFKNQLAGILEIENGDPGCWYYHSEITVDWARQMTVEGINEKGVWENPHNRPNHAWDCATLLLLAHELLGVAFWPKTEKPKSEPRTKEKRQDAPSPRVAYERPNWLSR